MSNPLPSPVIDAPALERRGRAWLLWSFLLCPCHLPLTLAALTAVLAGTSLGVVLRDHAWIAGGIITLAWLAGTAYGLRLVRRAEKANGSCPMPPTGRPAVPTVTDTPGAPTGPEHTTTALASERV